MRILMTLHHPMETNSGAPGVTLAIARALEKKGCRVDFYSFDEAFGRRPTSLAHCVQFPARVAMHLARHAHSYDIIDTSSGDAWLWASVARPGAARTPALVTRSHGLEQIDDRTLRDDIRAGRFRVRRRYYLYHGGFRLWEVARSLQLADHVVLLNEGDLEFTRRELRIAASRSSVVPHGVREEFFSSDIASRAGEEIRLAFIGQWIERKGISTVITVMTRLIDSGIRAKLLLLGTKPEREVLESFPSHVRRAVHIVPTFENERLPNLLCGSDVLLSTSRAEGFPLTLIEGMAAGLAPLSTPAGAAPEIIEHGRNGLLLPYGDHAAFTESILHLALDRARLHNMRRNARKTAARYRWQDIAEKTLNVYRFAREARLDASVRCGGAAAQTGTVSR